MRPPPLPLLVKANHCWSKWRIAILACEFGDKSVLGGKMFEPSWPQLNPYLCQTADDKTWQLMSTEAWLPLGAWLFIHNLAGSAHDRADFKWGTRERTVGRKVVDEFQEVARRLCVVAASLLLAARAARLGLRPVAAALEVCASIAKGWQLNPLQQGYS